MTLKERAERLLGSIRQPPINDLADLVRDQQAEIERLTGKASLEAAVQRAAGELPLGALVTVCVENGAGWVDWSGSEGGVNTIDSADLSLADQVNAAIDAARLIETKEGT